MNILVINGSPRTLGNTSKLLNAFLSGFSKGDLVKTFNMFELMPVPCNACGYCKAADGCSKKDLEEFFGYYSEADLIVVATPIYNYSVPAPLKALIDRCQRFYEAKNRRKINNPIEKPKNAVIIITAGCEGKVGFEIAKKQIEGAFFNMNTTVTGSLLVSNTDEKPVGDYDIDRAKKLINNI